MRHTIVLICPKIAYVFPGGLSGKEPACQCRRHKRCGFYHWRPEDLLEKETATHSSILAWRIPWTEEPGGLQFIWSQWVERYWSDLGMWKLHFPAPLPFKDTYSLKQSHLKFQVMSEKKQRVYNFIWKK